MLKLKLSRALKVATRCTVLSDGVRHRVCVDRPLSSSDSLRDCIAVYVLRLYYFFHCTPPPPPPLKQQEGESGADFARRVFSAVFEDDVQRLLNMEARLS